MNGRMLIADDDDSIRFLLRQRFEACGLTVDEAASGAEVLGGLAAREYDLVLLDLNFADMTGQDVLRRLGDRRLPPFIVLSGEDRSPWTGAQAPPPVIDAIAKPFDIDNLARRVCALIGPDGGSARAAAAAALQFRPTPEIIDTVEREAARARRFGSQFSLMFIEAGAAENPLIPEILDTMLRKADHLLVDTADRWAVILPGTGISGARQLAGRIRSRVLSRGGRGSRPGLRTGIGICGAADTPAAVIRSAYEDLLRFTETRADLAPPENGALPEILLVEDDESLAFLIGMRLRKSGYRVNVAGTKQETLATLSEKAPDLVLLDVSLPDGSGIEILRLIRKLPELKALPVIMLTALGTREQVEEGLAAGADAYLTKPFDPQDLLAALNARCQVQTSQHR